MKKWDILISVVVTIIIFTSNLFAQEEIQIEGPLAGASACHKCRLLRQNRVQITPGAMFTFLDEYRHHIFLGARVEYGILEWLSLGVNFGYAGPIHWDSNSVDEVAKKSPLALETNRVNYPFSDDEFAKKHTKELFGTLTWYTSLQLLFIPFRGKFSLFGKLFLDVDFYVFLGYALVGVEERANVDCRTEDDFKLHGETNIPSPPPAQAPEKCPAWDSSIKRQSRVAFSAGTYGAGISMYANNFIAVNLEYRITPFAWNASGTDERGVSGELKKGAGGTTYRPYDPNGEFPDKVINENDRLWQVNHMLFLGVTIALPITPKLSE